MESTDVKQTSTEVSAAEREVRTLKNKVNKLETRIKQLVDTHTQQQKKNAEAAAQQEKKQRELEVRLARMELVNNNPLSAQHGFAALTGLNPGINPAVQNTIPIPKSLLTQQQIEILQLQSNINKSDEKPALSKKTSPAKKSPASANNKSGGNNKSASSNKTGASKATKTSSKVAADKKKLKKIADKRRGRRVRRDSNTTYVKDSNVGRGLAPTINKQSFPLENQIFVGGLPRPFDEWDLVDTFKGFGSVAGIDRAGRNYAFVGFDDAWTKERVLKHTEKFTIEGREVRVQCATNKKPDKEGEKPSVNGN